MADAPEIDRTVRNMSAKRERTLTGWGLTMPSSADVLSVFDDAEVHDAVLSSGDRGVLARGAGRSYGDAAQNGGGLVLDLMGRTSFDIADDGSVTAYAGVVLGDLIPELIARGRFLPVTAGTRYITVGGAIAADVHGKNHHRDGAFGDHVRWIELITADGTLHRLARDGSFDDQRIFYATLGGMGLTGVILRACFDTIASPTSAVCVDTDRFNDLDSLMAAMVSGDDRYRYSVAWVDGTAKGAKLGRGVLTRGDHAEVAEVYGQPTKVIPTGDAPKLASPPIPMSPLNRLSIGMFNEAYFRRAPKLRVGEIQSLASFFYPLDVLAGWNRVYGRGGFLQYQFAVPDAGAEVVRTSLEQLGLIGAPSFLSVLKRFGPGRTRSPLSFPIHGWTLAIDVPTRVDGLAEVLDGLDELVLAAEGRLYLAKDSRMSPHTLERGYPQLNEFRAVKSDLDPRGVFTSDLARRLQI